MRQQQTAPSLILASASPRRQQLLAQIGIEPTKVMPANIDETPQTNEQPHIYARRIALGKADALWPAIRASHDHTLLLAADTVVACGRRILPKAEDEETAHACLSLLSGRRHRVMTAVALYHTDGRIWQRLVSTMVQFKSLSDQEINGYLADGEWHGKAGGYAIQGRGACLVKRLDGSYSNVVGLPLFETRHLLEAAGLSIW